MNDKEQTAITRLQEAPRMSLQVYRQPLVVTTSGGKDSGVCVALAERAGIPFEVQHNHTTADAPETVYFVRAEFKRLEAAGIKCIINYPVYKGKRTSMIYWGNGGREKAMLEIVPMTLREANAFVEQNHRHHGKVVGHKFSIGLSDGDKIVGVAIVGRPVARHLDDGWTLEVNRLCTDGSRNACSMLYAAAWRAARAMGYKRVVTYILESENGASLRASGWKCVGQAGGLRWTGKRRPEVDLYPAQMKIRFEKEAD